MPAPIYSSDAYKGFQKYFNQVVSEAMKKAIATAREEDIEKFTNDAFKEFCMLYGGISVYIPMPKSDYLNARSKIIEKEFDGKNHLELARKYGISIQTVYKILERARKRKNA